MRRGGVDARPRRRAARQVRRTVEHVRADRDHGVVGGQTHRARRRAHLDRRCRSTTPRLHVLDAHLAATPDRRRRRAPDRRRRSRPRLPRPPRAHGRSVHPPTGRRPGPGSTARATSPNASRTATSSSSAASTTRSRSAATASSSARSKPRSPPIPTSPAPSSPPTSYAAGDTRLVAYYTHVNEPTAAELRSHLASEPPQLHGAGGLRPPRRVPAHPQQEDRPQRARRHPPSHPTTHIARPAPAARHRDRHRRHLARRPRHRRTSTATTTSSTSGATPSWRSASSPRIERAHRSGLSADQPLQGADRGEPRRVAAGRGLAHRLDLVGGRPARRRPPPLLRRVTVPHHGAELHRTSPDTSAPTSRCTRSSPRAWTPTRRRTRASRRWPPTTSPR